MSTETTRTAATMTAGELIAVLSQFPADFPVTIGCPTDENVSDATHYYFPEWFNIQSVWAPEYYAETDEYENPSIILLGANDFDTRQW